MFLDVFNAVQRVTSTIPKRHPYHHECIKSLQLVFRDPSDQGIARTKATPPPEANVQIYGNVGEGKRILSPATITEIRCLLVHIDLSGILPGRGTNCNERLHDSINVHMKCNRYDTELAYGLISAAMLKHNEKK